MELKERSRGGQATRNDTGLWRLLSSSLDLVEAGTLQCEFVLAGHRRHGKSCPQENKFPLPVVLERIQRAILTVTDLIPGIPPQNESPRHDAETLQRGFEVARSREIEVRDSTIRQVLDLRAYTEFAR